MNQLDHLVIATPDLASAKAAFAAATGCVPADGGAHEGWGTRNALVSLGSDAYLEIIAPDPAQSLDGNLGGTLASLSETVPLHWAVRVTNLGDVAEHARELGFAAGTIRSMSRRQPNGRRLEWKLMGIAGHDLGGFVPFFIDWLQCTHPSTTNPIVGNLVSFEVRAPAGPLHALLEKTDGVTVNSGTPDWHAVIATKKGEVIYEASELLGFDL